MNRYLNKKIDSGWAISIIIILALTASGLILWEANKEIFPAEQVSPLNVWVNK